MDDRNNNNPFDDFFKSRTDEGVDKRNDNRGGETRESDSPGTPAREDRQSTPSYYYSYGPFKSNALDAQTAGSDSAAPEPHGTSVPTGTAAGSADVLPHRPLRPATGHHRPAPVQRTWQVQERRSSRLRTVFASFMAGVIVVGGLMFASDQLNWFTGDAGTAVSGAPHAEVQPVVSSGGGSVSNAMDVVRPNNIAQIFEKSSPAVVKIETYVNRRTNTGSGSLFDDPFFRQFFGDNFAVPSQPESGSNGQMTPNGLGSGFFFDKTGYILTNQHVVGGADRITVTVQGFDEPFEAQLLGSSYDLDLAVLKIKGTQDFPTLPLGDSHAINVGEWVVAIGNPSGFDHTVTVGVLSAKERPISIPDAQGTRNYEHLLQTDASINPGNSGGPLINLSGEVIGINTAVSTSAQGIGFAIPTSTIKEVLEDLKANKQLPQPFIGATLTNVTEEMAAQLGLNDATGAIVYNVMLNSPSYKADLRQYDVILGMDGKKYKNKEELIEAIQKKKVGDKAVLDVVRGGKSVQITIDIGDKNDFNNAQ